MTTTAVNLVKGGNVNLSKSAPTTKTFRVGLGWDVKADSTMKDEVDVDVMAVITDALDKGATSASCRFYNNIDGTGKTSADHYKNMDKDAAFAEASKLAEASSVVTTKDNLTGDGDGDDETLFVNGTLLKDDQKIKVCVNIYEAASRKQVFGMVKNAYVKVYDDAGGELVKYDLGEDFSLETGVIVGEFYKVNGELKFKALGTGFNGDLNGLINQFA